MGDEEREQKDWPGIRKIPDSIRNSAILPPRIDPWGFREMDARVTFGARRNNPNKNGH